MYARFIPLSWCVVVVCRKNQLISDPEYATDKIQKPADSYRAENN